MKQRTLGILGAALLVGGVVLSIASGIASSRLAPQDGAGMNRPGFGAMPRHRTPGQPGPFFGNPHSGFPARPGQNAPIATPGSPANPTPSS
jgi:hypothetical protein